MNAAENMAAAPKKKLEEGKIQAPQSGAAPNVEMTQEERQQLEQRVMQALKDEIESYQNLDPIILQIAHRMTAMNFVRAREAGSTETKIVYYSNVKFCNDATSRNEAEIFSEEAWKSPLEQAIHSIFYGKINGNPFWAPYGAAKTMACDRCIACGVPSQVKQCPYVIAAVIQLFAAKAKTAPDNVFRLLLREQFREIPKEKQIEIEVEMFPKEINAKTALAVWILLKLGLEGMEDLCKSQQRYLMGQIYDEVKCPTERQQSSTGKRNCRECHFSYCPDRAAYLIKDYARRRNLSPVDVAFSLFRMRKGALSDMDWYNNSEQYSYILDNFHFTEESCQTYQKIIRTIINHKKNRMINLSLNLIIHTDDNSVSDEIYDRIYNRAVSVYDYFDTAKSGGLNTKAINGKKDSLSRIIDCIAEIKSQRKKTIRKLQ